MSDFSADWLTLREEADARARANRLLDALMAADRRTDGQLQQQYSEILDLGAGTGANLRYLAPHLGSGQRWRCIDQNPALLARLPQATTDWAERHGYRIDVETDTSSLRFAGPAWNGSAHCEQRNLAAAPGTEASPKQAPLPPGFPLPLPHAGLITASALLDLVSKDWLANLISSCRRARCTLLFALSFDGRVVLAPGSPEDSAVSRLVNLHQRGEKGFGAALGPSAPDVAEHLLTTAGYWWRSAKSDWQIGSDEPELQQTLIAGWLQAALELEPRARPWLMNWRRARHEQIAAGALQIQVGHRDLIALPPECVLPGAALTTT